MQNYEIHQKDLSRKFEELCAELSKYGCRIYIFFGHGRQHGLRISKETHKGTLGIEAAAKDRVNHGYNIAEI